MKKIFTSILLLVITGAFAQQLKRAVPAKEFLQVIPDYVYDHTIIIKVMESPATNADNYDLLRDSKLYDEIKTSLTGIDYTLSRQITQPKEYLLDLKRKGERNTATQLANLSLYYKIRLLNGDKTQKIKVFNRLLAIDKLACAYFPVKYEDGEEQVFTDFFSQAYKATPDFTNRQFYLGPPPEGYDAYYAWTKPGADGSGIYFGDIESGIRYPDQEDLIHNPIKDVSKYPANITDHCTAVFGEILAAHNGIGVDGFAPAIDSSFYSDIFEDQAKQVRDVANAMMRVGSNLRPGDVFLIEMQSQASQVPNYLYMPVEYSQAEFDVIQNLVANGVSVVEAGGNGNRDLDDESKYGQVWDTAYRYSGALIVGCANAGTTHGGTNPPRSKHKWSNYGKRIDFYGYGERISTTGYGDLYGSSTQDAYTAIFGGTSGASPMVAGSAVLLQSIYKTATNGALLTPLQIRDLLRLNTTPSNNPSVDRIASMPNLKAAVDQLFILAGKKEIATQAERKLKIYPQPFENSFKIYLEKTTGNVSLQLYNTLGEIVLEETFYHTATTFTKEINLSHYPSGIYFLNLKTAEQSYIEKLIKR